MAKKKKKKETKKKFLYQVELYGLILILLGILGICGYGPCGEFICAFAAFLFGCLYFVFLTALIIIGFYIILKKEYPDFWNTKIVGFYIFIIGILMLLHMSYINNGFLGFQNTMEETFKNSMHVFDIINGASRNLAFENIGGGIIGGFFISLFASLFDVSGVKIIYIVLIIFGALVVTGISIADIIKNIVSGSRKMLPKHEEVEEEKHDVKINDHEEEDSKVVISSINELKKAKIIDNNVVESNVDSQDKEEIEIIRPNENYKLPPLNLIDPPKKTKYNNQAGI